MYDFMDKLISVALPRVRDFKGVPNDSFDGRGVCSCGVLWSFLLLVDHCFLCHNSISYFTKGIPRSVNNSLAYRMLEYYKSTVVPALIKKFSYKNVNEVPKLEKVVLNMGLGDVKDNSRLR